MNIDLLEKKKKGKKTKHNDASTKPLLKKAPKNIVMPTASTGIHDNGRVELASFWNLINQDNEAAAWGASLPPARPFSVSQSRVATVCVIIFHSCLLW